MTQLRILMSALFLLAGTVPVVAKDTRLQALQTGDEAMPWQAVGRLDIGRIGFCTGALISPQLVLTAAHCLFDRATGKRVNHETIEFRAGWRDGRAAAYRNVKRAVIHSEYVYDGEVTSERIRNDIALLELDHPIRNTTIEPFETAARPHVGEEVGVVSYARDRAEAPSLQGTCDVMDRQQGVLITSCSVDLGSSGAPIFTFASGAPQIVSVVSAKAQIDGRNVSLGTALGEPLVVLRERLDAGHGVYQPAGPAPTRLRIGQGRQSAGAKFIRPDGS